MNKQARPLSIGYARWNQLFYTLYNVAINRLFHSSQIASISKACTWLSSKSGAITLSLLFYTLYQRIFSSFIVLYLESQLLVVARCLGYLLVVCRGSLVSQGYGGVLQCIRLLVVCPCLRTLLKHGCAFVLLLMAMSILLVLHPPRVLLGGPRGELVCPQCSSLVCLVQQWLGQVVARL